MIDYVEKAIASISEAFKKTSSNLYILHGEEGIGKTTLAQKFCFLHNDTVCFDCGDEFKLLSLISPNASSKNYDRHLSLYKPLIKNLQQKKIHNIIFDIDKKTSEDFFELIVNIYDVFNMQKYYLNILILINYKTYHHFCDFFDKLPKIIHLKSLCKWTQHDFFQLWEEMYHNSEENSKAISIISEYSMGNVSVFFHNLNTLKYFNLFVFEQGQWKINNYEAITEILSSEYSDIVKKKYEALSPELRIIIKKTSAIGYIFDSNTLKNVFNINNSKNVLDKIEKLSMLLFYTDSLKQMGQFDSEYVQKQIESLIEPEQLTEWCELLGDYYESTAKISPYISLERCSLEEKCIFYFTKSNNTDKVVFHYLSLIPLKFNLSQYKSAESIVNKLISVTDELDQYKHIYNYCYYMLAVIDKSITEYTTALNNLNRYINLSNTRSLKIKALKAELLYDIGNITEAYYILHEMYADKISICDPNLLVNIISMLSSIEETMGINTYIAHFNEALTIANKNKLYADYYRLLRKANMAHIGENAIMMMNEAKKFFIKNNMINELIMVQHNIGTEALFYVNTYKYALSNLKAAHKTACEIGFSQLCYIENSLAIFDIFDGQYSNAIDILNGLLNYEQEDFTMLAIYINKATCLKAMNLNNEAYENLEKAINLNKKDGNNFPFYSAQITLFNAFANLEKGEIQHACGNLIEYLQRKYDDRDVNTIAAKIVLNEICEKYNLAKPQELCGFSTNYDEISRKISKNHLVICELMFWE